MDEGPPRKTQQEFPPAGRCVPPESGAIYPPALGAPALPQTGEDEGAHVSRKHSQALARTFRTSRVAAQALGCDFVPQACKCLVQICCDLGGVLAIAEGDRPCDLHEAWSRAKFKRQIGVFTIHVLLRKSSARQGGFAAD